VGGDFIIHQLNSFDMHFVMHPNGLHYYDTTQKCELTMVQAVKDTSEGFSEIQIQKAKEVCEFQEKLAIPAHEI
jgi:hypothetical protein